MLYSVTFRSASGHEKLTTCNQQKVDEYVQEGWSVVSMEAVKPPVINLPQDIPHA